MIKLAILSTILYLFLSHNSIETAYAGTTNTTTEYSVRQEVLYYINQYRKAHHLSALKLESSISKEASQHSEDMAQHRLRFGHDLFNQRVKRLMKLFPTVNASAENVAYAYKDGQDVVANWVKSPGHRKNILGNYNLTGIGIARDKQGKLYYTQIFMHDKNSSS